MPSRPPGPRGLLLLGNTLGYGRDPVGFRERCVRRYGDVVATSVLGEDLYLVARPDLVREILVEDPAAYRIPTFTKKRLAPVLGEGLLMADGERWQRDRPIVQEAFSREAIAAYAPIVAAEARRLRDRWTDGAVVDVGAAMRETAIRVILQVVFGRDLDPAAEGLVDAVARVVAPASPSRQALFVLAPRWLPLPMHRRFRRGIERLEAFIDERHAALDGGTAADRSDLFSRLLTATTPDGSGLSRTAIRDEVMTALVAGHATTAYGLAFTWHLLGRHPGVYDRFLAELDGLDEPVAPADCRTLSVATRVLTEALRLYPPAHEVRREARRDVELGGYAVPAGTIVAMPMWPIHRDTRWYDDPGAFRPSRWADGLDEHVPEFAYFPFGGGQRHCVAEGFARLEALSILATVGQRFRLEPLDDDPPSVTAAVNLKPTSPVRMRVHRR